MIHHHNGIGHNRYTERQYLIILVVSLALCGGVDSSVIFKLPGNIQSTANINSQVIHTRAAIDRQEKGFTINYHYLILRASSLITMSVSF